MSLLWRNSCMPRPALRNCVGGDMERRAARFAFIIENSGAYGVRRLAAALKAGASSRTPKLHPTIKNLSQKQFWAYVVRKNVKLRVLRCGVRGAGCGVQGVRLPLVRPVRPVRPALRTCPTCLPHPPPASRAVRVVCPPWLGGERGCLRHGGKILLQKRIFKQNHKGSCRNMGIPGNHGDS